MSFSPDPETLHKLREFSRQQVREYLAEQKKKKSVATSAKARTSPKKKNMKAPARAKTSPAIASK